MPYSAQLLPDEHGCTALRKIMNKTITSYENGERIGLTDEEMDALYALYAKLTEDMRRRR